jgi:hypothetical protein
MLNKKKPAGREPAGFEQIGRLGELLAQLLSGFAADEFNTAPIPLAPSALRHRS